MLAAGQFRVDIELGKPLEANYRMHSLELYAMLLGANVLTYAASFLLKQHPWVSQHVHPGRQFRLLLLSIMLASGAILVLMPKISLLQVTYFNVMTLLLGIFLILLPGRMRKDSHQKLSIIDNFQQIYDKRYLIQIWASYRIQERYTRTSLGLLWIVLFPIMESLVIAFAFSQLLGRGSFGGVPFILFLLSGRISFMLFQKIVVKGKTAIQQMSGVIRQVYFPREVIILLLSVEVVVDFLFAFAGFLVIALFYNVTPNVYYLLLPIPVILMLLLALGVGFIIAWLGLLVRDLQPLVDIAMQLLFYVTIFFDSSNVASNLRFIPLLNPVSAMVEAFRDITIYNRMPDFVSLYFPAVLSIALLYTGYVFFKVNEDRFADYL